MSSIPGNFNAREARSWRNPYTGEPHQPMSNSLYYGGLAVCVVAFIAAVIALAFTGSP